MNGFVASYPQLLGLPPILDFEASGLCEKESYPISVGVVVEGSLYYWVIKPKSDWVYWCGNAAQIHNLSRTYIEAVGQDPDYVAESIVSLLGGRKEIFSDCPSAESMWSSKLGLDVNYRHINTLLEPQRAGSFPETLAKIKQKHKLVSHKASDDALALALSLLDLSYYANT